VLMWQPSTLQWRIIWPVALLLVAVWPADQDRSLALKAVNYLVDPTDSLPILPGPLAMGLGDDPAAVAEHDAVTMDYDRLYATSWWMRIRLELKDARDPFSPSTERQLLTGFGVVAALLVWRLEPRNQSSRSGSSR
jgi:hypothetical protein